MTASHPACMCKLLTLTTAGSARGEGPRGVPGGDDFSQCRATDASHGDHADRGGGVRGRGGHSCGRTVDAVSAPSSFGNGFLEVFRFFCLLVCFVVLFPALPHFVMKGDVKIERFQTTRKGQDETLLE